MIKALIFDVDGTLAETEEAHRHAFNASFAAHGLDWHWSVKEYTQLLKVTGGKERMRAHCDSIGCALTDQEIAGIHKDKTKRYGEMLETGGIVLRPGIAALVEGARNNGLALAVATTTSGPNVEALCQACWGKSATEVFDVVAAGDEVTAKKPAPDVYLLALERLGLPGGETIAFEDSRNGVLSARAAGIMVAISPTAYTADDDFS